MKKMFTNVIRVLFLGTAFAAAATEMHDGVPYRKEANVAQYKGSDYKNAIRVARNISLEQAFRIANSDPNVDYFVYLKGGQMVLEIPPGTPFDPKDDPLHLVNYTPFIYDSGMPSEGNCRIFRHGDTVFFKKEGQWLGSAPGYADAYFKE